MATTTPLQLFPPPPSKSVRPKRKGSRRNSSKPIPLVTVSERTVTPSPNEEIILRVAAEKNASARSSVVLGRQQRAGTPSANLPSREQAASPTPTNNESVVSDGTTLVRSHSNASTFVPMRSMFPRYNPNVPLAEQQYRPTQASPTHIPREIISKAPYSPSVYSPGHPGTPGTGYAAGPATAPPTINSFPEGVLNKRELQFSSREELSELWEAANGQNTETAGRTFALKMTRAGTVEAPSGAFAPSVNESFSFGGAENQIFYDLQTLKANDFDTSSSECNIRRHDPFKGVVVPVMSFNLDSPSTNDDGLIALLYPKLAAMMALDKASMAAEALQSPKTDAESRDSEAVRAAANREGCKLYWDHDSQRYYLHHPGLKDGSSQRFAVLIEGTTGLDALGARGTIRLIDPESEETLVSLEFGTATLMINTIATSHVKSLYIVDVAVSAILAVALLEGRKFRAKNRFSCPPQMTTAGPVVTSAVHEAPMTSQQQELSSPAKGFLNVLFLAYQFLVWVLTALVGAIATIVVGLSACFSKSK
ncbi:MAG: hypothetical protein M4579_003200 [Chaenotheca gracillima]|nr:MAG: hypothetical protein M4579_003200 [Chaenotheca gracillima]